MMNHHEIIPLSGIQVILGSLQTKISEETVEVTLWGREGEIIAQSVIPISKQPLFPPKSPAPRDLAVCPLPRALRLCVGALTDEENQEAHENALKVLQDFARKNLP